MNRDDFAEGLEQELRLRGVTFDRRDLLAFVRDAWPLIDDRPDAAHWAQEFAAFRAEVARVADPAIRRPREFIDGSTET